MSIWLIPLA
jgi:origin recognition complex subunit 5